MIELWIIVSLLVCHFIGDFIIQNDTMAVNKSKSNYWLTVHVSTYMIPFIVFYGIIASNPVTFILLIVSNFALHWITDYITSRVASHFFAQEKRGLFFKTIGFDQLIHGICLVTLHVLIFL